MPVIQSVILSGGSGTRLWPASRASLPKQLLPLTGDHTMLQQTALRLQGSKQVAASTMVICNDAHRFLVAEQLRSIAMPARIVLEPEGRNTAPAVALAALAALAENERDEAPLLLVMPADHIIRDERAFLAAVQEGTESAVNGSLVTFGILPTEPNTGYGYIEAASTGAGVTGIESFIEKPDLATARQLIVTGRHYWNAGIFLLRADRYLEELESFAPEMLAACRASIETAVSDAEFLRPGADAFRRCPSDSIDYAVMEKTQRAAMVPLDAGWSDVGSWAALHDVSEQDSDGNSLRGDVVTYDCKSSYVSSASRLVTAVGLENVIIVEDKDSVLVVRKDNSQDVKGLVDELKRRNRDEVGRHRLVFRPWGSYDSLEADEGFQVKRLVINPGCELSLQKHAHRSEHWVVVIGTATITLNDDVFDKSVNEYVHIPVGAVHRISNRGDSPLHIIEVQCGEYLGEDDIVRLQDNYGREDTKA